MFSCLPSFLTTHTKLLMQGILFSGGLFMENPSPLMNACVSCLKALCWSVKCLVMMLANTLAMWRMLTAKIPLHTSFLSRVLAFCTLHTQNVLTNMNFLHLYCFPILINLSLLIIFLLLWSQLLLTLRKFHFSQQQQTALRSNWSPLWLMTQPPSMATPSTTNQSSATGRVSRCQPLFALIHLKICGVDPSTKFMLLPTISMCNFLL